MPGSLPSSALKEGRRIWEMPPPELTTLVARRDALEGMRTQEHNRAARSTRPSPRNHLAFLDKAVKDIDAEIRQKTDGDTPLKKQRELLDSIPSLGVKTIPVLLALFLQRKMLPQLQAGGQALIRVSINPAPAAASVESRACLTWHHVFLRKAM